jgi:hypothetical protein
MCYGIGFWLFLSRLRSNDIWPVSTNQPAIDEEISTLEIVKRVGPFLMCDQSRSGTSHTTLGEAVRSCRLSMLFVWAKRGNAAVINRLMMVRFINAPAAFDAESGL